MYAERDNISENASVRPSVRLSVYHTLLLYVNERTYRQTLSNV